MTDREVNNRLLREAAIFILSPIIPSYYWAEGSLSLGVCLSGMLSGDRHSSPLTDACFHFNVAL